MASASSARHMMIILSNLGPRTPSGLARGARVELLPNSPATAAATEGAQRAVHFDSSEPEPQPGDGPVSIADAANKLAVAQNEVFSAKLAVFRAFLLLIRRDSKTVHFWTRLRFAQKFSSSFLQYWNGVLAATPINLHTTKASYAIVVGAGRPASAAAGTTADPVTAGPQNQWQQQRASRRQGQRNPPPPPKDDLRVFARLGAGLNADMSRSFAFWTHIADKLGIPLSRIPQAHPCKTGC